MFPTTDQHLQREMAATERLLWSGRPPQGLRRGRDSVTLFFFSLLWLGIAGFAGWNLYQEGEPPAEYVPLIVPLVIGLYLLIGRPLGDAYNRAHTYYGISDRRALILREKPVRRLLELPLASLPEPGLESSGMDGGEILLGPDTQVYRRERRRRRRVTRRGPRFELENGARNAFETLRRAREDAQRKLEQG